MPNNIKPITALRDTSKIEAEAHASNEPIFITRNGYGDLVLMSEECYYERFSPSRSIPSSKKTERLVLSSSELDDPMGFVRARAASFPVSICGVSSNVNEIKRCIQEASEDGVKILVFPELCMTGYSAADLFQNEAILRNVESGIEEIRAFSESYDLLFAFGAPIAQGNSLFNSAVVVHQGKILGVVPKANIPNYGEFYEKRWFQEAPSENEAIVLNGKSYPFGTKLIFIDERYPNLKISVEICEDIWVPNSPSISHCLMGSTVVLNLSASNETIGKADYRRSLLKSVSTKQMCAYIYATAGEGESTTDLVFSGQQMIAENGHILAEAKIFEDHFATADLDIEKLCSCRRKSASFREEEIPGYDFLAFSMKLSEPKTIERNYPKNPFLPKGEAMDLDWVKTVLVMQASGLSQRLKATHQQKVILGLSGGLDSTLALLVCVMAFERMKLPRENILAVTMPAFGTSKRTKGNAELLAEQLGVSFRVIDIKASLEQHLNDIGHGSENLSVGFENAQARERTQILMDLGNDEGALMVGTGDLSELCLGWCTYGGDHMSMYGVNSSLPKTVVRYLCKGYAALHPEVAGPLLDIVDTPISPELLPADQKGQIAQLTEDKIGPYELHDFFLYHFLKFSYRPKKLYRIACRAFEGSYDPKEIQRWLREFFRRFFASQFKRSCLPDGPKISPVGISPRGDWRMPSDATSEDFLREIDEIRQND